MNGLNEKPETVEKLILAGMVAFNAFYASFAGWDLVSAVRYLLTA